MLKLITVRFGLATLLLTGQMAYASCSAKDPVPPVARTFAAANAHGHWHEYRNIETIPELETDGGESAQFWRESDGSSAVYMVSPGEDFWTYTRYCFDRAGLLSQVGFEVRTAWGWSYMLEGIVAESKLRPNSTQFFSTVSGEPITRPSGANDVSDALNPVLYLNLTRLPFAKLLSGLSAGTRN